MRLLFALLLFCSPLVAANEVVMAPLVQSGITLFDAWVTSQIQSRQIPGVTIAIVYKDSIVWKKAYGKASLTPVQATTSDTLFPLGALTKPFTASAIMKLWQEGKIDLDSALARYLPDFEIQGYHPTKNPITVRQLLNHTSGLPQDAAFPYWNDLEFPLFPAIWQTIKGQQLVYKPGTTWKYSHLGYAILGKIVEVASGQEYSDFVQKNMLDPLIMTSTTFRPHTVKDKKLSQGFTDLSQGRKIIPFYDLKGMKAALGIYSNVEDMGRFASFFLSPDDPLNVLRLSSRRYMTQSSLTINPQMGYGLGFAVRREKDAVFIEHPGSMPGSSCYLSMSPKNRCAVIIMCNSEEWLVPWVNEAYRWVFSAIGQTEKGSSTHKPVPFEWHKYRGKYTNREHDVYVEIHDGKLVLYEPSYINELDTLEPQSDGTFRILQGYTFGSTNGDPVSFHLKADGQVAYMKIANIYMYP